jgi:sialidase-1
MERRALTVRVSRDSGKTWPVVIPVDAGLSAYSSLAPLPEGRVGLLYERGRSVQITFTELTIPQPGAARFNEGPRE